MIIYMTKKIIKILSHEIYYKNEKKESYVFDFHYDSVNNKILFIDNAEKTNKLQCWIDNLYLKFKDFLPNNNHKWWKVIRIFEHEGKKYFFLRNNDYYFSTNIKYYIVDSNYNKLSEFETDSTKHVCLIDDLICCVNKSCHEIYNIYKEKLWTLNIGLEDLTCYNISKKTTNNTFYVIDNGYLYLFHATDNVKIIEPIKINLNIHMNYYYEFWSESIKDDIYIYSNTGQEIEIVICNVQTKQIRMDYNAISCMKYKMGNMIVLYEEQHKNFIDFTTNEQLRVIDSKNDIMKPKTYDLFFQFE